MEYIESRDGIYDGKPTQCWRYHPVDAPKGRRFWTDDLPPVEEGWVDSPAKFPGAERDPSIITSSTEAPDRPAPVECFRYHKDHGAKRFWTNALPREEDGWFDNPVDAGKWQPSDEAETDEGDETPDPMGFDTLNTFMQRWCDAFLTDDMAPTRKGEVKKEGIEAYAKAKFCIDVDRRRKLEELVAEVEALEA